MDIVFDAAVEIGLPFTFRKYRVLIPFVRSPMNRKHRPEIV
jgi:hypothetical protein